MKEVEKLNNYKKDYSVYVLRVEMKTLGRRLINEKDTLIEDEVLKIKQAMSDIKSTLKDLKVKYGVYNETTREIEI